tara:strand:+ start:1200 stop:1982 length:783 start_codon:yes stop_codon:yes gene_type:complete
MKKILIVEGNLKQENQNFTDAGIQTHTESLIESLNYLNKNLKFDIVNPSSDQNIDMIKDKLIHYDGLIWGGSSLNIYNDTPEIKIQIDFMKKCQNKVKNILAICWGMQVAVTAAGGEVKKAKNAHIGMAIEIKINNNGIKDKIYKDKKPIFNAPAFNFDEVTKLPDSAICLASNKNNKIQSLFFEINGNKIWGLQYHPEITYEKMISLIEFRKKKLVEIRKVFNNDEEVKKHINFIKNEISSSNRKKRMLELENWLDQLD